jgi:hypothetical protein
MSTEMHTRFANILLILFFSYMPVFGQTNDSILVKAVEENLYQFKVENGVFTGSGANVIKEIIPGSQFLLVGEQHGISEPALFTETLFQEAIQFKYSYLAIETDPFVAKKLESTIRESQEAVFEFLKTYPGSVPFYATQEDLKLVQTAVSLSAANESVLWGVDQVFLGAPRLLFSRLSEMAPDPNARQMAEEYYEKAQSAFVKFAETGNPGNLMMVQLTEDDFQNLYDAFGTDSSRETFKMINGLKESQQIYSLWMQGNHYENNYTRVRLIKRQFIEYYRQAKQDDELPRVVFRFGLTHTMRGLSMYDQFDLGNLAFELAEMNEMKAISFRITGIKGSAQGFMGPPQSFDNTDSIHPAIMESVAGHSPDEGWFLLDFRPLRKLPTQVIQPVRELIHSYDFWVLVPAAKPVTNI